MKWLVSLSIVSVAALFFSCTALLPMVEKGAESVVEEIIDDSIISAIRKEVIKTIAVLVIAATAIGYGIHKWERSK